MWKLGLEAEEEERGGGEDEDEDEDEDEEEDEEEMRILGALRWAEIWDAVEVTPERSDIKCRRWQRRKRKCEGGEKRTY